MSELSKGAKVYESERMEFTKQMKDEYTILFPSMLPLHFEMLKNIFNLNGFNCIMLTKEGRDVVDAGLQNVHNDTCYPALLVIGQMIDALDSGKYDTNKIALLITQTFGGCRASNYVHLLRKALKHKGYAHIPVISLNFNGMEKNDGFELSANLLHQLVYAVLMGDFLMLLQNQTKPYEVEKGSTDALCQEWIIKTTQHFKENKFAKYSWFKKAYKEILNDFDKLPRIKEDRVKVGVVGEIYVKYAPLGNNNLEDFLIAEGAEVVIPGLMDFLLYCIENGRIDRKLYGGGFVYAMGCKLAYKYLVGKQNDMIKVINEHGVFSPPTSFEITKKLADNYVHKGIKMGEGWLLTAEMAELIHQGVNNIVCTQPFGCLPNHIVAKGKLRLIKEMHPESNIVPIDYDPGATQVNQENRIKLMLATAEHNKKKANANV